MNFENMICNCKISISHNADNAYYTITTIINSSKTRVNYLDENLYYYIFVYIISPLHILSEGNYIPQPCIHNGYSKEAMASCGTTRLGKEKSRYKNNIRTKLTMLNT